MDLWAYQNRVQIAFSCPGKPTDNAFVESFNGTFRAECLDGHWFTTLAETRQIIESWPHRALGDKTPNEFACQVAAGRDLTGPKKAEKLALEVM